MIFMLMKNAENLEIEVFRIFSKEIIPGSPA